MTLGSLPKPLLMNMLIGQHSAGSLIQRLSALLILLVSIFTLAGWIYFKPIILNPQNGLSTLHPLTCVGFIFLALAIRLSRQEKLNRIWARLVVFLRLSATGVGLLIIVINKSNEGQLFVDALFDMGGLKLLPSQASGFSLTLLGLTAFLRKAQRNHFLSQACLVLVSMICLAPLLASLYGSNSIVNTARPSYWLMELPTALLMLLATLTLLIRQSHRGALATFAANAASKTIARLLLPASILVPIALGWLRLIAESQGWVQPQFGLLFHVLASIFIMLAIVWGCVDSLARKTALIEERKEYNADLESTYRTLLDICDRPVFGYNNHGQITYLNPAAAKFFSFTLPQDTKAFMQSLVGNLAWGKSFAPMLLGCHASNKTHTVFVQRRDLTSVPIDLQIVQLYRSKHDFEILAFVHLRNQGQEVPEKIIETNKEVLPQMGAIR